MVTDFSPSETISNTPVIATVQLNLLAKDLATLMPSSLSLFKSDSDASTPFVSDSNPAINFISDIFPRKTLIFISSRILLVVSFLNDDAPAPTGSSTTGIFNSLAFFPDAIIDSIVLSFKVPIFITSAEAIDVISADSFKSSAIIGDAPIARSILAQSFTVT